MPDNSRSKAAQAKAAGQVTGIWDMEGRTERVAAAPNSVRAVMSEEQTAPGKRFPTGHRAGNGKAAVHQAGSADRPAILYFFKSSTREGCVMHKDAAP